MNAKRIALAVSGAVAAAMIGLPAMAQDPIKIGSSLPLTGGFAVTGTKHKEGFEMCVKMINDAGGLLGHPVELIVSDNRSDTETALAQYERLINVDGVDITFGTFSSKLSFPVSSVLNKYGMLHPIPSGGALRIWEQGFDNQFYFQQNAGEYAGRTVVNGLKQLTGDNMPTTAALVHADDFFANAIRAGFLGEQVMDPGSGKLVRDMAPGFLADVGIEAVYTETWPEEGFSDWLNLANSIKNSNAELVIGLTASAEEAVQLTRALKTVGATPKAIYLSQGTQLEFQEGLGPDTAGVMVQSSWDGAVPFQGMINGKPYSNQDFMRDFEVEFGRAADEDSAIPFALCQGIEQAVRATDTDDNAKLIAWLRARTKDDPVKTVLGDFYWDERGLPIDRDFLLVQWQDEQLKFIYPTEGMGDIIVPILYPKPDWN
jgi:branched-chain amino acid transport system substrate-binding protein